MLICLMSVSAIVVDFLLFCCEMGLIVCKKESCERNKGATKILFVVRFHNKMEFVAFLLWICCAI